MNFPVDVTTVQQQIQAAAQEGNADMEIACCNALEMLKAANMLYLQACAGQPRKEFFGMTPEYFVGHYLADRNSKDTLSAAGDDGMDNLAFASDWLQVFRDAIKQGTKNRRKNMTR